MILLSELIIFSINLLKITNATVLKTRHFKSHDVHRFPKHFCHMQLHLATTMLVFVQKIIVKISSRVKWEISLTLGRLNRICPSSVYVRARARTNVRVCTCRCGWVYIRACVRCYIGNCQAFITWTICLQLKLRLLCFVC